MALNQILAGGIIYADDIQDEIDFLTALTVEATDNPTKSADTALANDSQLVLAYPAGTFEMWVYVYYGAGTTADFKAALTFTNATVNWAMPGAITTAGAVSIDRGLAEASGTAHSFGGLGLTTYAVLDYRGRLTATSAGTLRFQWCQNTSTVENTVRKAGSFMTLRPVA